MSTKMSRFVAVAAASLAIGLGAYAAQPDGQGGPGGPGGWHHHGEFKEELNKLHGQLNLSPDQEKQWQAALDTMKQNREASRAAHKQMHDQMKALQQQPILDLNALHDMHQKAEEQNHQLREQTSAAWLNFYNGLNDKQKTIVSTALKQHWAKMEARHEKMREHWQHHQGAASAPAANQ
ncbi:MULTISPECIES: periplasmic heavy metal sensor [Paraburkholderia]|jgi:protein CpxP|uniref:Heavy-metal resistance n=1 Tax=Paraburkholderia phenazinium TaxID=60549 RepID=A0A1N6LF86_9BURK|nr:periplasmic heavy metal sensor [Paraburkholderia phenazinium]SIO67464.1 Heavy-metal resistance [Paraburkholderia phenazinium]